MKFKVPCFRLDFIPSFCISCTKVWNLLHYTFVSLAPRNEISCTKFRFFIVNACKMKHWKQKWNIQRVCFMLWNAYKSIVFVQKVKHWNMISRIICVRINCNLSKSCATNASSPGGDASSRWHCQLGTRCPSWQYSCINITQKGRLQQMESALFFFERLEFYRTPIINNIWFWLRLLLGFLLFCFFFLAEYNGRTSW